MKQFFSLLLYITVTHAIKIDLHAKEKRCIGQQLDEEDYATFNVNPVLASTLSELVHSIGIQASIVGPAGSTLLNERVRAGDKKEISKNIELQGVYQFCFENPGKVDLQVNFGINFKNRKVQAQVVDENNIADVEVQLSKLEVLLQDINHEIEFANRQEDLLKAQIENINARIQYFSYLSIFVLLTTALWQLLYLRNFFSEKKLL